MTICVIYLDDFIVFADTFEEHLNRLDLVLTRLKQFYLKLSPGKCTFILGKVGFLGHVVSLDGIETEPEKIEVGRFCRFWHKSLKQSSHFINSLPSLTRLTLL